MMPPWIWDAVTTDCRGNPEAVVAYIVVVLLVQFAGWRTDCAIDESGAEVCVQNAVYFQPVLVSEEAVTGTSYPQESVYVPPLGGVSLVNVEARDAAGNVSGGVCP